MIRNAMRTMLACVLWSALAGASVQAQETRGTAVENPNAPAAQPAPAKPRRATATPVVTQPVTPPARKLYQHTTSMGKTCCAACEEIASDGSCKTWGQCSPNVTTCDAWTN
jgi:hypothetical protein